MKKVIKQIKIHDDEGSIGDLYALPDSDNLLYRYPCTGRLSVHVTCRLCAYFRKEMLASNAPPCRLGKCLGVEGDIVEVHEDGKLSIQQSPKHLKNFLKAVQSK